MVSKKTSQILSDKEKLVTVGGVHDELRYTEPYNLFFKEAKGSKLWDIDGKTYTDFLLGYGPLILGHCSQKVVQAVKKAAEISDLWKSMNKQGIMLSPHHLKRCHVSTVHTKADASKFLTTAKNAFESITTD